MPTGGHVRIATRNENDDVLGQRVILELTDTGTGMTPDVRARALEPYFTTKAAQAGSGLGLAIVKSFVRLVGGDIAIGSAPGHGTTVRLSFPPGIWPTDNGASPPDEPMLASDATVLIVDDDTALRRSVRRRLAAAGFQCLEAADGGQAMQVLAQAERVDLLFADLVMPGQLDGHTLARSAMRTYPGVRVVLTSARPEGNALPGIPILAKPYRNRDLVRTLHATLALPPPVSD